MRSSHVQDSVLDWQYKMDREQVRSYKAGSLCPFPFESEVSSGQGLYCVSYFSASSKALTKVMFERAGSVNNLEGGRMSIRKVKGVT